MTQQETNGTVGTTAGRLSGMWPAWLVLVLSLATTLTVWRESSREAEQLMRADFEARVDEIHNDLDSRIASYALILKSGAALFATSDKVTRERWKRYVDGLQLSEDFPAIQALAYAENVADKDLTEFIARQRQAGSPDFSIRPPGRRERYVVNVYAEPRTELNAKALGYDMWQDEVRRGVMEQALRLQQPTITPKTTLKVDETSNPVPAFIMYMPVWDPATGKPRGFVLSPFRMPILAADLLTQMKKGVALSIYDGTELAEKDLLYRSPPERENHGARFSMRVITRIAGRDWTLLFTSEPSLEASAIAHRPLHTLVAGLLLSLALSAIAWSLASTRRRAVERHSVVIKSAMDGFLVLGLDGGIRECNDAMSKLTGYAPNELMHRSITDFDVGQKRRGMASHIATVVKEGHDRFESSWRGKDGHPFEVEITLSFLEIGHEICAFVRDITLTKQHQRELDHIAHYDALTGIPNRTLLADRMTQAVRQSRRSGKLLAVCFLDLDGFKPVNDRHGHPVGDLLLIEVAKRLENCLRAGDSVARLGGDEFVLLLLGLDNREECESALARILDAVAQPMNLAGHVVAVSASLGVALFPNDDTDTDTLLRHADQAMYQAKQAGRNRYRFFAANSADTA